jgi:hypothetical protein
MHNSGGKLGDIVMAKHARTTISVPPDLKARMDTVDEPVNWSAIACQAFEEKLAEITKRKGAKDMRAAIQRLKVSKRKLEAKGHQVGFKAGETWAMSRAEADELQRLAQFYEACERDSSGWVGFFNMSENSSAYSPSERIAIAIGGEEYDGNRGFAQDFWKEVDLDLRDPAANLFVRSFVEGAMELWNQIKDEIVS